MTSGADAPAPWPRHGDVVVVGEREAVFLYRRGDAAIVRFHGEEDSRVVPLSKIKRAGLGP